MRLLQWVIELRQVLVAPFVHDHTILDQYQSRIGADDGLQRDLVRVDEWISSFGTAAHLGLELLHLVGLQSRGCHAIEAISVLLRILVYVVDFLALVCQCLLNSVAYHQEGVTRVLENLLRDVSVVWVFHGEVMDRRFESFLDQFVL